MRAPRYDTSLVDFAIRNKELQIIQYQAMDRDSSPCGLPHNPVMNLRREIDELLFKRDMILKYGNDIVHESDTIIFS